MEVNQANGSEEKGKYSWKMEQERKKEMACSLYPNMKRLGSILSRERT